MGACECENPMEFGYEVNAEEKDERQSETNNFNSQKNYVINNIENNYPNTMSNLISIDSNKEKIHSKKDSNLQNNYELEEHQENQKNQLVKDNQEQQGNQKQQENQKQHENQKQQENQVQQEGEEEQDNQEFPEDKDFQKNQDYQENQEIENNNQINQINQNNQVEKKEKKLEGVEALRARVEEDNYPNDTSYENKMPEMPKPINEPVDDFSKYIYENINQIRENPQCFIPKIEKAKDNIVNDKTGIIIYKSSVKVALYKGKPAFDETIQFLKKIKPMKKLAFKSDLMVKPPQNEYEIQDKTYMNEMINVKVQQGIPIKSFWRDIIRDAETCLILMIVDDTGANSGKKRFDVLDPSMENIGIVSKKIGKYFASYLILS